jgi:hypothetical protein
VRGREEEESNWDGERVERAMGIVQARLGT